MGNQNHKNLESQIVSLLQKRDKQAVSIIYDNYAPALFGVILRIVKTQENAEEVLQNVLLKVWNNSTSYDATKGRLYTWLLNISRNAAIDFTRTVKFKSSKNTDAFNPDMFNDNAAFGASSTPKDIGLEKMINGLDQKYKELIDLVYFNQYTQSEVSQELNIPLGTVKSRLRKALSELRNILGDEINLSLFAAIFLYM